MTFHLVTVSSWETCSCRWTECSGTELCLMCDKTTWRRLRAPIKRALRNGLMQEEEEGCAASSHKPQWCQLLQKQKLSSVLVSVLDLDPFPKICLEIVTISPAGFPGIYWSKKIPALRSCCQPSAGATSRGPQWWVGDGAVPTALCMAVVPAPHLAQRTRAGRGGSEENA